MHLTPKSCVVSLLKMLTYSLVCCAFASAHALLLGAIYYFCDSFMYDQFAITVQSCFQGVSGVSSKVLGSEVQGSRFKVLRDWLLADQSPPNDIVSNSFHLTTIIQPMNLYPVNLELRN